MSAPIPYHVLGCNYGPAQSTEFQELVQEILSKAQDVCFRDQVSADRFGELGNVRHASDIVFNLDTTKWSHLKKEKLLVVSLVDLTAKNKSQYQNAYEFQISNTVSEYIKRGYRVVLVSFCRAEGDESVIRRVLESHKSVWLDKVSSYNYAGDIEATVGLFAMAETVIASRFHAMILGLLFNCKTIPIAYSNKMTDFLEDAGCNGDVTRVEDFSYGVNPLIDDRRYVSIDLAEQKMSAELQFRELDKVLDLRYE